MIHSQNKETFRGQYDQAISDLDKATELDPKGGELYNNRAVAYYIKGEYDKASEDVRNALNLGYRVQEGFLKALREASGR